MRWRACPPSPGWTPYNHRSAYRERGRRVKRRRRGDRSRGQSDIGLQAKEFGQPLRAPKGKGTDCPLQSPEGKKPSQPILNFQFLEL